MSDIMNYSLFIAAESIDIDLFLSEICVKKLPSSQVKLLQDSTSNLKQDYKLIRLEIEKDNPKGLLDFILTQFSVECPKTCVDFAYDFVYLANYNDGSQYLYEIISDNDVLDIVENSSNVNVIITTSYKY